MQRNLNVASSHRRAIDRQAPSKLYVWRLCVSQILELYFVMYRRSQGKQISLLKKYTSLPLNVDMLQRQLFLPAKKEATHCVCLENTTEVYINYLEFQESRSFVFAKTLSRKTSSIHTQPTNWNTQYNALMQIHAIYTILSKNNNHNPISFPSRVKRPRGWSVVGKSWGVGDLREGICFSWWLFLLTRAFYFLFMSKKYIVHCSYGKVFLGCHTSRREFA